jgi:predicted outer membrane protein
LDQAWLMRHIQTNLFEIEGGHAAQLKATTPEVRAFAAELVADHTAALDQATAVAEQVGVEVPTEPSPLQQWALRAVDTFTGIDYDRWFIELQIDAHTEAIAETEFEIAQGCNLLVVQLAEAALPVLERHLAEAQAILAALPAGAG